MILDPKQTATLHSVRHQLSNRTLHTQDILANLTTEPYACKIKPLCDALNENGWCVVQQSNIRGGTKSCSASHSRNFLTYCHISEETKQEGTQRDSEKENLQSSVYLLSDRQGQNTRSAERQTNPNPTGRRKIRNRVEAQMGQNQEKTNQGQLECKTVDNLPKESGISAQTNEDEELQVRSQAGSTR